MTVSRLDDGATRLIKSVSPALLDEVAMTLDTDTVIGLLPGSHRSAYSLRLKVDDKEEFATLRSTLSAAGLSSLFTAASASSPIRFGMDRVEGTAIMEDGTDCPFEVLHEEGEGHAILLLPLPGPSLDRMIDEKLRLFSARGEDLGYLGHDVADLAFLVSWAGGLANSHLSGLRPGIAGRLDAAMSEIVTDGLTRTFYAGIPRDVDRSILAADMAVLRRECLAIWPHSGLSFGAVIEHPFPSPPA